MFQPPGKTDSNSPRSEFRWSGWKGQQKSNEAFTTFFRFEMCHKIWRFAKCTAVRQITSQRVQLMPRKNGSKSSLLQFTATWPGYIDLRPGLNKSDTPAPFDQNCSKKRYSWSPEPPVYSPFTSGVCIPARFDHIFFVSMHPCSFWSYWWLRKTNILNKGMIMMIVIKRDIEQRDACPAAASGSITKIDRSKVGWGKAGEQQGQQKW